MAAGPFARIIAQIIVPAVAVLVRALPAAYAQALGNARKGGVTAAQAVTRKLMSRDEALQILNLHQEEKISVELIRKQYDKYMEANEVKRGGGSFYLQSKVYRAMELLEEYEKEKHEDEDKSKHRE